MGQISHFMWNKKQKLMKRIQFKDVATFRYIWNACPVCPVSSPYSKLTRSVSGIARCRILCFISNMCWCLLLTLFPLTSYFLEKFQFYKRVICKYDSCKHFGINNKKYKKQIGHWWFYNTISNIFESLTLTLNLKLRKGSEEEK